MPDLDLVVENLSIDFLCFDTINIRRGNVSINGVVALVAYQLRDENKVLFDQDATSLILARALYMIEEAERREGQPINLNFNGQRVDPNDLQGFSLGYIPVNPYKTKEMLYEAMQRKGLNFREHLNLTPSASDIPGLSAVQSKEAQA